MFNRKDCTVTLHVIPVLHHPQCTARRSPSLCGAFPLLSPWVSIYRCCCWSYDGGSGMRISNRGCRCGGGRRWCSAWSLPRSAVVVAEPFALGEAMAARPLRDRSRRDLLQRRPEAHLPGVCAERGPVPLAPARDRGELQEPGGGWIQLERERWGACFALASFHGAVQMALFCVAVLHRKQRECKF